MKKLAIAIALILALVVTSVIYANLQQAFVGNGVSVATFGLQDGNALVTHIETGDTYSLVFTLFREDGSFTVLASVPLEIQRIPDRIEIVLCGKYAHITSNWIPDGLYYYRLDLPVASTDQCKSSGIFFPVMNK